MSDSAERNILGAILLDNRAYERAAALGPEDFSRSAHRLIFARMRDLRESSQPIDWNTLSDALEQHKELKSVGGLAYIVGLVDGVPERSPIQHDVTTVRRAANRRHAEMLLEQGQRVVHDSSIPTSALSEIGGELIALATDSDGEPVPPRFSEDRLALRFSRQYRDELRYVARWASWMRWDGTRWVADHTLHVFDLARRICRAASSECDDAKVAVKIASKATSAAVERLASADRCHAATTSQWDTDPWSLNTPAGTVDLRSGQIREHRCADYISKITAAGPGGDCPLWTSFLDRVTGGDSQLQSFLQRVVGYGLTGSTREHALFFLFGTGANGKSVFLSTLSGLLAEYATTAPATSFTSNSTDQHPTDLAGLRGARFVTAIETEEGAKWAESKIKSLTGGDKIAARFMRCDFFEFTPEFKLIIAGNHKPSLRSVDEAIRRRFHLVPFTITIPRAERDPNLVEKLRAEYPGILAWAVQGCLNWQRVGLNPPPAVRDATADYLNAEDAIGRWIEERCVVRPTSWTATGALFADYQAWCGQAGEREDSPKHFTQQLEVHGFNRQRTNQGRGFLRITLLEAVVSDVTGAPIFPVSRARAWTSHMGESDTSDTQSSNQSQIEVKLAEADEPIGSGSDQPNDDS